MKKLPILLIGCLAIACHGRHPNHPAGPDANTGQKTAFPDSAQAKIVPDTSMRSLTMGFKVSLVDVLSQRWKMEDADHAHWNDLFWDSVANKRKFPGLDLFKDFKATFNARCDVQLGSWTLDPDKRLLILRLGKASKTYYIQSLALKKMVLVTREKDGLSRIIFSAESIVHKRPWEDPFYPANNAWRIKPEKPETQDQIRKRAIACVRFFSLFFKDNYLRQAQDISFIGLPSCFTWYNGGIAMQEQTELDQKWIDCFYSREQAQIAYGLLGDLLESHTLKWPEHPTSWVQQTGDVLDQMANRL